MPVSWSWPWGQESSLELETNMGWDFASTSSGAGQPTTSIVYTYAGSPTRYSWAQDEGSFNNYFRLPTTSWVPKGWICVPFYVNGTLGNKDMLEVKGGGSGRRTYIKHTSSGTGALYVDNSFKANFAGLTQNDWHFLALKYDMDGTVSAGSWSGQVYLNGAAVTSVETQSQPAEVAGVYTLYGFANGGTRETYYGGIIIYDSLSDAGEVPRYVTRVSPNDDAATTLGTWTPSSGSDDFAVTNNDPFSNSSFTQESSPSSADQCVTEVTNFASQLGITPPDIDGITNHTYSSGTGVTVTPGVGSGTAYQDGANVVPDASDTTYGFATSPTDPSGGNWSSGTTLRLRYKVV